jgi:lysophospholipase L1-like esterase
MAIWRVVWLFICILSIAVAAPVIFSGSLRSNYAYVLNSQIAAIWPPRFAFLGDSLTLNCNWRWELGSLSLINVAMGGVGIREVAHQLNQVVPLKPGFISIEGGINDIVLESSPVERIAYDFEYLLRQLPPKQPAIVTLIPFVSNHSFSGTIQQANSTIRSHAERRGLQIIDLNPLISDQGVRKSQMMTTDGVHFNHDACLAWVDEIRKKIASSSIAM